MTEQQIIESVLTYLFIVDYRYTTPSVLTPDDCPSPLRYPVVTTYDMDCDLQIFIACVINPEETGQATEWVNDLAGQIMAQWAPPGEEPLEFDCVTWVGTEPPSALRGVQA